MLNVKTIFDTFQILGKEEFSKRTNTPLSSTEAQLFGPSIGTTSMTRSAMRDRVCSTSLWQVITLGCCCSPCPELPQQHSHSIHELQIINSNVNKEN